MQANLYLNNVLRQKKASLLDRQSALLLARQLYPMIKKWAGNYLLEIIPSGSFAKGTSVKGITDIDLFVSLRNQHPDTLGELYNSLFDYLNVFLPVRKQNVSIRINYSGKNVDIVPAKRMPNAVFPHSIYLNKKDTWMKTNINKHISIVKSSGRSNEIVLMKIWRELNGLDFPSFYLELSVIEALKGRRIVGLEKNIMTIFEYLIEEFKYARITDPANTQNVISEDLNDSEKEKIVEAALVGFSLPYWNNVIW